jgi:type II secretory pathway pseudopilin PulG
MSYFPKVFKVSRPPFFVRRFSRAGFTLAELLVVIVVIIILGGIFLGPVAGPNGGGFLRAKQTAGMQTARLLALAEYQYANDNKQNYPDVSNPGSQSAAGAPAVANCLLTGGYISDPTIFWIGGSSETQYTGSITTPAIATGNISWDFVGNANKHGVNPTAPDTLPLVWSSLAASGATEPNLATAGAQTCRLAKTSPFGTIGIAVCYKSNSAAFLVATVSNSSVQITNTAYPGWTAIILQGGG